MTITREPIFSGGPGYLHGETRRSRHEQDIAVNPDGKEIIAHEVTDDANSDAAMIGCLVTSYCGNVRSAIPKQSPQKIVIPPGRSSIFNEDQPHDGIERERYAAKNAARWRMAW